MPTKKQLAAQLAALNAKTAKDLEAAQAQINDNQAAIAEAAAQPYAEEVPGNLDIPAYLKAIETGALPPGVLKSGFTEGPLPEQYQKLLGNPDILGWRLVTNPDGSQNIQVQTGAGSTSTFGADVSGNAPKVVGGGGAGGNTATIKTDAQIAAELKAGENKAARQSAYDTLYNEFSKYGLGSLVEDVKGMIQDVNVAPSQIAIALQNTDAYKKRFSANQDRIKQGLRALTPAEYVGLEDQYQNIMRNYGLPATYWTKDDMGTQAGFNKFIANDVSAAELEDRIATAQKRVLNADVNVKDALRQFYPDITNADILAYTLDPTNALENIKRKVTAAEIGGAALAQGLGTSQANAEDLARYGITKAQAQQGYASIGEFLPTASQLGDIYAKQGIGPYTQATAEAEVFNTANAADAARKRKRLAELERASFAGSSGTSGNALNRDRAMTNQMLGTPGAGSF